MTNRRVIFLVDDNKMVSEIMSELLASYGFCVKTAFTGSSALEIYKQIFKTVDLAILDLKLPDINGMDLCLQLRQIDPNLKILFMSGYSLCDNLNDFMQEQTNCIFIQKPVRCAELHKIIKSLIGE